MKDFKNIKNFIFDCDGVLYKDLDAVFGQVSKKMGEYISRKLNIDLKKAKELQRNYFHQYNTSLNGLMIHHKIDPHEFLEYVHDINLDFLKKDTVLREELLKLDAKKFVYTNGSRDHVNNITKHLGIDGLFDGVFDIVDGQFIPKPQIEPFKILIKKFDINPEETVFIEDIAKNLSVKKELNLKTVWLINNEYWGKQDSDKNYIDVRIENLTSFLKEINILKTA
jgi:putative hydrolase of the HAD superfamily